MSCWSCSVEVRHAYRGGNEHEEDAESAIQPNCPREGHQGRGKKEEPRAGSQSGKMNNLELCLEGGKPIQWEQHALPELQIKKTVIRARRST